MLNSGQYAVLYILQIWLQARGEADISQVQALPAPEVIIVTPRQREVWRA
ncbi:hypothetical protein [[Pantoea] beijingensis]|nr:MULTISPECIES: hypothetical protein [Erwiniaceae]